LQSGQDRTGVPSPELKAKKNPNILILVQNNLKAKKEQRFKGLYKT
jgi:hypothetical protein